MKVILFVILLASSTVAYAADEGGKFAIKGIGNSSCGNFLELSEKASLNKFLYAGWLNGYLTGQNQLLNKTFDISSWQNVHTLGEYLRNYCKKNRDKSFYIAVASMVNGMYKKRVKVYSPTENIGTGKDTVILYTNTLKSVQKRLKKLGLFRGKTDGKLNKNTQDAIRSFQKKSKLPQTGSPDQQTLHALLVNQ